MSGFIEEVKGYPEKQLCPYHKENFKKKGFYWHCPQYWECGYSIGSRPRVGFVTKLWIKQSKKGQELMQKMRDAIRRCTEVFE